MGHLRQPNKSGLLPGENPSAKTAAKDGRQPPKATDKRAQVMRVKAQILSLYEQGHTADDACRISGKSKEIWKYYRKTDPDFRDKADLITARKNGRKATPQDRDISFEEFSEKYQKELLEWLRFRRFAR